MCIFLVLPRILCYVDFVSGSKNMAISLFGKIGSLKMLLKMLKIVDCRLYGITQTTPLETRYREIMDEKRIGIFDHVAGVHTRSDNETYKKCTHG